MLSRTSLRTRIFLGFAGLGTLLSLGLGTIVFVAHERFEHSALNRLLEMEVESVRARRTERPGPLAVDTAAMQIWRIDPQAEDRLPEGLRGMDPGFHLTRIDEREVMVFVRDADGDRFVAAHDITTAEAQASVLYLVLASATLLTAYLAIWLGYLSSRRLVGPLRELADTVTHLPADDLAPISNSEYPRDEIGRLVAAFNDYRARLAEMLHRERAFTSDVSHELRTPLSVIRTTAEVMERDPEMGDRQRDRARRIMRAAEDMAELVEAFLTLAREEDATQAQAFDAHAFIGRIVESQRVWLEDRPVELRMDVRSNAIRAPESPLFVVVSNLVRNAFIYTKRGHVAISLGESFISVEDTGPGMSEDERAGLFERRSDKARGTGIGLAIVKRICDHYHWEIEVVSEPRFGTRFTLIW